MATSNVSVSSGGSSTSVGNTNNYPATSAIEHDEVVYPSSCKPDPAPTPSPDKDCCCKTYHIVLNFQ